MHKTHWKVPYAYLLQQFANPKKYFQALGKVVATGDFTLGRELIKFENIFAQKIGVKYAVGVANGTDALYLTLKALGIGKGDEVITPPNSFIASTAVIALTGATPVFVDVRDDFTIDAKLIEKAVTARTRAIIPVHLTGIPSDMQPIMKIAQRHNLYVVEDVAQAAMGKYDNKYLGAIGIAGCFSFHPLKILNVWGDGGMITTNNSLLADNLRKWRNHGLTSREEVEFFAFNSRLHTVQAAIALCELPKLWRIIKKRRQIAKFYDQSFAGLEPNVHVPDRNLHEKRVAPTFTTYVIQVKNRNKLADFLIKCGIEVKIHYPIPIHLQKAAKYLSYKRGDFPITELQADTILSLPNHQYLTYSQIKYVMSQIKKFYTL